MPKKKPAKTATGTVHGSRHEYHDHEHDVIRAFVTMKLTQVQRALKKYQVAYDNSKEPSLQGQIVYWANIVSYLRQVLGGGMRSADHDDWRAAWVQVAVTERHTGAGDGEHSTQTIPGME